MGVVPAVVVAVLPGRLMGSRCALRAVLVGAMVAVVEGSSSNTSRMWVVVVVGQVVDGVPVAVAVASEVFGAHLRVAPSATKKDLLVGYRDTRSFMRANLREFSIPSS
jgi:hypothetical protein